jgi:hypothetical protein
MLILDHLLDDDEPLNLILAETRVSERSKERLKLPYKNQIITDDQVKLALKALIANRLITVLNEKGKNLEYTNINEILNEIVPWKFWFRITESGRDEVQKSYKHFWKDD